MLIPKEMSSRVNKLIDEKGKSLKLEKRGIRNLMQFFYFYFYNMIFNQIFYREI